MRRLLALFLAHLTATVAATLALAIRRTITYDVPLTHSLTPVRFLPHLIFGPFFAVMSLSRFMTDDDQFEKRFFESVGYIVPFLVCYLIYTRLLVGKRRRDTVGFTPIVGAEVPAGGERRETL